MTYLDLHCQISSSLYLIEHFLCQSLDDIYIEVVAEDNPFKEGLKVDVLLNILAEETAALDMLAVAAITRPLPLHVVEQFAAKLSCKELFAD